jgi:hypothetical protein
MLCKFFSRKLFVFLLGFITGTTLCLLGKLDPTAANFIEVMTAVYLGGNVLNAIKFNTKLGSTNEIK